MISGPSSYLPTIDTFLAHWAAVNAEPLADEGLLTRDGTARVGLVSLRGALEQAATDVQNRLNSKEIARARVENGKRSLLARSQELGRRLRGILPQDSPYLRAVPELPVQTAAQEVFLQPVRDMALLWARLDADGVSFELANRVTVTSFRDEVSTLSGLYQQLNTAVLDLKLAREKRNALQTQAKTILSAYRPAVEGLFPPDSPLVKTIPIIYPPAGYTPAAVTASATYDAAASEAVVNFTESTEADLENYQLRGVPGPDYDAEDEVVLATLPKGAPRVFRTNFSLSEPGTTASYKVYVMLTNGSESGSKPVTVARE